MADWCALPEGVVALIATSLQVIEDFIAFRATCSCWRKTTTLKDFYTSSSSSSCPKLPFLMLNMMNINQEREFWNLPKGKICKISLPESKGMECFGSKGWLIMVERSTGNMSLFHPLTRAQIPLPNAPIQFNTSILPSDFKTAVLSASPSVTSDYVVIVVFLEVGYFSGSHMGFWKPGNRTWTRVKIPRSVEDLNYYNGKFYALTLVAEVWMFDVSVPNPKASKIIELPWHWSRPRAQFVECGGRLLIVAPFCQQHYYKTAYEHDLKMVELDVIKGSYNIITSLGSSTVFLGRNEGFSIDANKFRGVIEPNSICFSDGSYQIAARGPNHISPPGSSNGIWVNF